MRIAIIGAGPGGIALGIIVNRTARSTRTFWGMTRRFKAADSIFELA